jgi:hypothetical protein
MQESKGPVRDGLEAIGNPALMDVNIGIPGQSCSRSGFRSRDVPFVQ